MQIHEISIKKTKKKRIGRGGKRGTYSGRGMKGQKARSGGNVDPLFEGGRTTLVDKMKKLRGFKSPHAKKVVVSLAKIEKNYIDGDTVSVVSLIEKKIIKSTSLKNDVKILAVGTITKKVTIASGIGVSATAQAQIEKAGGTIASADKK
ncbi:MAG: 50S ribosomal protein L15 [Parcubacteria group bacterium]|jgi:large subunit ribosomal protein L15